MGKAKKSWVVTTGGDRPLAEIRKDLAKAGLGDVQVLEAIGVIMGSGDDAAASKCRKIRGVTDVSPSVPVDIGPPGSRETW